MKFIFLGPPGAGKGTLAAKVAASYNIPHISTGEIFRAAIKAKTPLGLKVQAIIDSGALVSDDITIELVKDRLSQADAQNGFIRDGFPRTIPQAKALDNMGIIVDAALSIEVADSEIVKRMSGRRVCEKCGASYHIEYKKPQKDGICNACGGNLVIRKDDEPETVLNRLTVYHDQTEPLKEYYAKQNKLLTVEGQDDVKDTTALVLKALSEL